MDNLEDRALRQSVVDELEFDPSLNASRIGVAASDGIVTLSGYVASFAEKVAAEDATRRVRGVRAIAQEIEVRHPAGKKTSDDQIAKRVIDILRWSAILPRHKVDVTVSDGWVTLKGEVNWFYERRAAEDAAKQLGGVQGVINNITVRPHLKPGDVQREIEAALKRSAAVDAARIHVRVIDAGKVRIEGHVHTWHEHDIVARAAWSAPGVRQVEDRLTIA